jgi:hypothetical protein
MAAIAFLLYVVSVGSAPDFTVLAAFDTKAACDTAAAGVTQALSSGEDQKVAVCLSSDSLDTLAKSNGLVK